MTTLEKIVSKRLEIKSIFDNYKCEDINFAIFLPESTLHFLVSGETKLELIPELEKTLQCKIQVHFSDLIKPELLKEYEKLCLPVLSPFLDIHKMYEKYTSCVFEEKKVSKPTHLDSLINVLNTQQEYIIKICNSLKLINPKIMCHDQVLTFLVYEGGSVVEDDEWVMSVLLAEIFNFRVNVKCARFIDEKFLTVYENDSEDISSISKIREMFKRKYDECVFFYPPSYTNEYPCTESQCGEDIDEFLLEIKQQLKL